VTALRSGLSFGVAMTLVFALRHGWGAALVAGPCAGLAFGLVMGGFATIQKNRLMLRGELLDGERILYQGPANHWRGAEARGGWLVLTERALVFRAHGFNVQNAPVRLELSAIRGVLPRNTLGIVPNGMRVDRADGQQERFVVNKRGEWIRRIEARIAAA